MLNGLRENQRNVQKSDCFICTCRVYDIASGKQLRSFKGAMGDDGIILKVKAFITYIFHKCCYYSAPCICLELQFGHSDKSEAKDGVFQKTMKVANSFNTISADNLSFLFFTLSYVTRCCWTDLDSMQQQVVQINLLLFTTSTLESV